MKGVVSPKAPLRFAWGSAHITGGLWGVQKGCGKLGKNCLKKYLQF